MTYQQIQSPVREPTEAEKVYQQLDYLTQLTGKHESALKTTQATLTALTKPPTSTDTVLQPTKTMPQHLKDAFAHNVAPTAE